MTLIDLLLEPLQFVFMQRAFAVTLIAAMVCGILSCWLVLIGWSLMGDAVAHAVLPGVVIAYLVGTPFALGALVFALLAVLLIGGVRATGRVKEDAAIGVVFTSLFALGIVLISVFPSQTDLSHILFGSLLGVGTAELIQVAILGALTMAVLLLKRRDLVLYAFDPAHARTIGLSPRVLGAVLLTALAVTVVVALQAVGVILVVALVITPGATAYLLTDRFGRMLWIAPTVAAVSAVVGIYLSYFLDASPGGTIVLVLGALFALAYLFSPRHGLIGRVIRRRRRRRTAPNRPAPAPRLP